MNLVKSNAGVMLATLLVVWAARQTGYFYVDGY